MAAIGLKLLGGFEVTVAKGQTVRLPTRKAQALLAYLAMTPGRRVARDAAATLLWPHADEPAARNNLRQTGLALGAYGVDNAAKGFVEINAYGTPEQVVEKLRARRELIGDFNLSLVPAFGGLPAAAAEKSLRLIGEHVLPKLR